jgi:hypothetical protein
MTRIVAVVLATFALTAASAHAATLKLAGRRLHHQPHLHEGDHREGQRQLHAVVEHEDA